MGDPHNGLRVEVLLAAPGIVWRRTVRLPAGSTVAEAVEASGVREAMAEARGFDLERPGIYGRPVTMDETLRDGDRIEFYRPLEADPKEARRRRAARA